jgi:hypothetical protein
MGSLFALLGFLYGWMSFEGKEWAWVVRAIIEI